MESQHGQDIYYLQKDGIPLAESQAELTPLQREAYKRCKAYWTEKEREEAEENSPSNPNLS